MSKKYNLGKKSDMRKFQKDLEKEMYNLAKDSLSDESFEINCPHCNESIKVHEGLNTCDFCQNQINIDLKCDF